MRIEQLRLTNFKLFEDLRLDMKPLTLLTGANSSGKSSILSSLAAITQTDPPNLFPFEFVPNGTNCSLGSYRDIVTEHNNRRSFGIGFCAGHQERHVCLDASYRYAARGDHILLRSLEYKVDKDTFVMSWLGTQKGYIFRLNPQSLREVRSDQTFRKFLEAIEEFTIKEAKKQTKKPDIKINLQTKLLDIPTRRTVYHVSSRISQRELPERVRSNPAGRYLMSNLQGFVMQFRRSVGYVGPVRAFPLRYYPPDRPQSTIDPSGTRTAHLLHEWQKHNPRRSKEVSSLLSLLELTEHLEAESDAYDILKMLVKPYRHRETANLADVGFGVSQVLPLLVADVGLPEESVLLVNQPEVHLHPPAQAELANYFSARLKKRQYIIETHSEHLINRLRVLAQRGKLDPKLVSIVFFDTVTRGKGLVKKYDIELQSDGSLKGAPKSFFNTYYDDSFALAMGGSHK